MAELISQYSFVIGAVVCVLIFFGPQIWSGVKRVGFFVRKRLPSVATLKAPSGKIELTYLQFAGLILAMFLMMGGVKGCTLPTLPGLPSWTWVVAPKPTLIVMLHEESHGPLSSDAKGAANELTAAGREVRMVDDDVTDGLGETPDWLKPALEPGRKVMGGTDGKEKALVVLAGERVVKAVKLPPTRPEILEACK